MCCPYRCASKHQIKNYAAIYARSITIFGRDIPIVIRTLHCKQAITRRLLYNLTILNSHDTNKLQNIQQTIASFPGLHNFRFKLNPLFPTQLDDHDDDNTEIDNGTIKIPEITGRRNFDCVDKHDEMQATIWKLSAIVCFGYLEATNEQLRIRNMV